MQDIKDFAIFALKSQILWGVAIVWLITNIKWLFPQVPSEVLDSATDLITVIGVVVVAYLGGKDVESKRVSRFMARFAPKGQVTLDE